ncbi:caspase family protein [Streptomyces sp. PCS3-D2]|uniref:caspase family protein n=1 Tax=Streptomyces sp. PCS3-D2 TaxID=1460244 RepID=UPI000452A103|nr:caspase family protein [Streptomyces sp. PCS3-D2]WKV75389.1 caspase family protein [Streptomyces sp. PCS3-D2]
MPTVNCLLVGIDAYPTHPLTGCRNDVASAERWLRSLADPLVNIRVLTDAGAQRSAVVKEIKTHLGAVGPGDTALLWFSGHGSDRATEDPREATGRAQALVCHDSLDEGGLPLADDELGALLDGIAATGAHVVAVLDCCYSGGATREDRRARSLPWQPSWDRLTRRGAGRSLSGPAAGAPRHVLLAASRLDELAYETRVPDADPHPATEVSPSPVDPGSSHGVFSAALLEVLADLGPDASCREILDVATARMHGRPGRQHPTLHGRGDLGFLHGGRVPASRFRLGFAHGSWSVNCGSVHGLDAVGGEFTVRTPSGGTGTVAVREVFPERSRVEPLDGLAGALDRTRLTPAVPSAMAFRPAAVTVTGGGAWTGPLRSAIDDHPLLATGGAGTPLTVAVTDGVARVTGGSRPLPSLPLRDDGDVAGVVNALSHLAHWHRVRALANPDPTLSELVRVRVEPILGAQRLSATGELVHEYTPDGQPPQARITIHNTADRRLWCTLLDLTDSHGISHGLYEGDFVAPGHTAYALRGAPVLLYLPEGRLVQPGAYVQDWLKVIVSENEFDLEPLLLPAWSTENAGRSTRGASAPLLRVGGSAADRDLGGSSAAGRWGTSTLALRTEVPGPARW